MNYKQNCIERLPRKKTNIRYIMWWNKFFPEWVRYRNFYYSLVEFYENSWLDGEEKYAIVISGKQTHKKFLNIISPSYMVQTTFQFKTKEEAIEKAKNYIDEALFIKFCDKMG